MLFMLSHIQNDQKAVQVHYEELKRWVGKFDHPFMLATYAELASQTRFEDHISAAREYYALGANSAHRAQDKVYEATFQSELAHMAHLGEAKVAYFYSLGFVEREIARQT